MWKDMDFYLLLKTWVHIYVTSIVKNYTDAIKTALKRAIQNSPKATADLIGNKTVDKITSVLKESHSKKSSKGLHSKNNLDKANNEYQYQMNNGSQKKD